MPENRFFIEQDLEVGAHLSLDGGEHQHLSKSMRKGKGGTCELVNGKGVLAKALITEAGKRATQLQIQQIDQAPPPTVQRILIQAIPRLNRLDTIIEKTTELGVDQIWLFPGDRSEKTTLTDQQLQRTHQLRVAALKQCGRLYLPHLQLKPPITHWEALPSPTYFGDITEQAPHFQSVWRPPTKQVAFVIGPEGGLTPSEIEHLQALNAQGVNLHPLILRTDTAPIVAFSLISHWLTQC